MKSISVYDCPAYADLMPTIYTLIKRGTFSSAKQYRYLRDKYGSEVEDADKADVGTRFHSTKAPAGAELVIIFSEHFSGDGLKSYGKNYRRRERTIWCNSGGVIRIDAYKFHYDGKGGSHVTGIIVGAETPREPDPEVIRLDAEAAAKLATREADKAALLEKLKEVEIKAGRYEIIGKMISTKNVETQFGWATKMLIVREDGVKFYGTLPSGLSSDDVGKEVKFVATVEPKEVGFAFFSRPTVKKAKKTEECHA